MSYNEHEDGLSPRLEVLEPRILLDGAGPQLVGPSLIAAVDPPAQANAYSVPIWTDWNQDGVADLLVGEKTTDAFGKIRVYLGQTVGNSTYVEAHGYVQGPEGDLSVPAEGCLGVAPRVIDWNNDGLRDLVLGLGDGTVQVALNVGTDVAPRMAAPFQLANRSLRWNGEDSSWLSVRLASGDRLRSTMHLSKPPSRRKCGNVPSDGTFRRLPPADCPQQTHYVMPSFVRTSLSAVDEYTSTSSIAPKRKNRDFIGAQQMKRLSLQSAIGKKPFDRMSIGTWFSARMRSSGL